MHSQRGQVGIGPFITTILVVVIATAVLINTAGGLPSTTTTGGEQRSNQVTNYLTGVSSTGTDIDSATGRVGNASPLRTIESDADPTGRTT